MNTFDTIVYNLINVKNNIFNYNYDKTDKVGGIHKIFFYTLINIQNTKIYRNKMHFLNETINNFYFSQKLEERDEFINYFNKIQKIYHTLNRFCFLYKIKKAKIVVNSDLQLNEINLQQKNVISIYHNNNNYLFKIQDLLKIIYMSLTNTYMFFSEPITIKNPYNNLPFEKSILYYIYFHLIQNTFIAYIKIEYIDIFLKFKQCNFNMTKFIDSYEYILREHSFKNYINNSTKLQLKSDILTMIGEYNIVYSKYKIYINEEFPIDILIKTMKPYLNLYLIAYYSLVPKNKIAAKHKLNKKLKEFQIFNPSYGKKIIIIKNKIKNGKLVNYKSHTDFNFKCKKFNYNNDDNFMSNHLSYRYSDENDIDNQDNDTDNDNDNDNETIFENNNIPNQNTIMQFNYLQSMLLPHNADEQESNEQQYENENEDIEEDDVEEGDDTNTEIDSETELYYDDYDDYDDYDSIS